MDKNCLFNSALSHFLFKSYNSICHSLNIWTPSIFICWTPDACWDDIRMLGLQEMFRSWRMGAFIQEAWGAWKPPPTMWRHSERSATWKKTLTWACWHLDLKPHSLRNCGKNFVLFMSYPVCGIFLQQLRQTNSAFINLKLFVCLVFAYYLIPSLECKPHKNRIWGLPKQAGS